jgi:hypothetical protein|tara:strand:+ start:212 stop:856 length:645 start_codon:yes stop_codon:yes gene_type:complete
MKTRLDKKAVKTRFRVAIFGSARIKKNGRNYKLVHSLAKMIAREGIDIVTGGGPGLMDAASRGHHLGRKGKKLYTVGLTIHLPSEQKESFHLDVKEDFKRFSTRLDNFVYLSNVFVVAPGGIGTTLEFFYTWQLMQVKQTCNIPIILLGDMWNGLVNWIKKHQLKKGLLDKDDLGLVFLARNCSEAMKIIKDVHDKYKEGKKNICLNIQKYKMK